MKKLFIIANWKSNKTIKDTEKWIHDFSDGLSNTNIKLEEKNVIIAPSFTALEHAHYCSGNLNLALEFASQNVSEFDEGAYTGEVSARQIKELANYVIIGHSERRKNFEENDDIVNQKMQQALKQNLTPMLCVSSLREVQKSKFKIQNYSSKVKSYEHKILIAYEPLSAIGSGHPDTPENADRMCREIKNFLGEVPTLYGGSVNKDNIKSFTNMLNIDGALVGKSSLDPLEFLGIVKNA